MSSGAASRIKAIRACSHAPSRLLHGYCGPAGRSQPGTLALSLGKRGGDARVTESRRYAFSQLPTADLVIDALYEGGTRGNAPTIHSTRLLRCRNRWRIPISQALAAADSSSFPAIRICRTTVGRTYWTWSWAASPTTETTKHQGTAASRSAVGNDLLGVFADPPLDPPDRSAMRPSSSLRRACQGATSVSEALCVPGAAWAVGTRATSWRCGGQDHGPSLQNYPERPSRFSTSLSLPGLDRACPGG